MPPPSTRSNSVCPVLVRGCSDVSTSVNACATASTARPARALTLFDCPRSASSSTKVPHASQAGHFPSHRGAICPQAVHRYCVLVFMSVVSPLRCRTAKLDKLNGGESFGPSSCLHTRTLTIHCTLTVIATTTPADVAHAYAFCKDMTRTHAKTFYFASHTLPLPKRNACFAVYAFCRYVDDLVDVALERGDLTSVDAVSLVQSWNHALDALYKGHRITLRDGTDANNILIAWQDTLSKFRIPSNLPGELIEGVLMDTSVSRFATFTELYDYSYKVASVVGLMTTEIFGYSDSSALREAIDLGIAMQLTNIIRDVKEDAQRGRIYLPLDELARFGVSEHDVLEYRNGTAMRELLKYQCERARHYYRRADAGIPKLEADSRTTVYLMSMNYEKILDEVERRSYDVFSKRVSTSIFTKLSSFPKAWWFARRSA